MTIIFAFEQYKNLAENLAIRNGYELGKLVFRRFPEDESYVKLEIDVTDKKVILVCGLENADQKIMALMFFAKTAKELGALEVGLVAPYLGYMRMDKRFNKGEAVTSNIFAAFLSQQVDWLVTVDPHLHRHKTLEEIYSIPCQTLHATDLIASWIKENVANPVLIGPDEESNQWVSEVAKKINVPFLVLQKIRRGDRDVEVSLPEIARYRDCNPILIDDIVSTARTMIETVQTLKKLGTKSPICIGVHGIFVGSAFEDLRNSGAMKIVTCNTISHHSNIIDVTDLIACSLMNCGKLN